MPKSAFGEYLREKRLEKGLTLRSFCTRFGFDTAYISRLENNKLKPPSGDKLATLANSLGIAKNSRDWIKFFDLAYQAKSELPSDLKESVPEVLSLLPAFLRTPDGKKISREKIDKLIDFLEKDGVE